MTELAAAAAPCEHVAVLACCAKRLCLNAAQRRLCVLLEFA